MSVDKKFGFLDENGKSLHNGEKSENFIDKGKNKSKFNDIIKSSTLKYLIPTLMIAAGGVGLNKNHGDNPQKDDVQTTDAIYVNKKDTSIKLPQRKSVISGEIFGEKKGAYPGEFCRLKTGNEFTYLNAYKKLSDEDYKKLFADLSEVKQGYFGDCYLISTIKSLARTRYFDTLMKTSIQKNDDRSFELYLPLGNPNGREIHISKEELDLAQIKGSLGYKILEIGFSKEILLSKNLSQFYYLENPDIKLTRDSMDCVLGHNSFYALSKLLGYNDIKRQIIDNKPSKTSKILNELNKFDPTNLNIIIVSSRRRPKEISNSQKTYVVEDQKMYYHHAYSLFALEKCGNKIASVILEDPTNTKRKIKLSLRGFMDAFYAITTCSPQKGFLSTH